MAQYPVSDQQGLIDGLNYVLSGPGSLGQSFQGYSSNNTSALTGDIFDPNTGQVASGLPITTGYLQYYLTDCQVRNSVSGGTDKVVVSGQVNIDFDYESLADSSCQYTVAINRYRAYPNTSTNYYDYLWFEQTTVASHTYSFDLPTTTQGLMTVTASGTKIGYTQPSTGSLVYPVDYIQPGVNAFTGSGSDAVIQIQIAYGVAGTYNNLNTKITVISAGSNWSIGDTIKIPGADLGGITGVNDLILTVTGLTGATPTITQETIFTNIIDTPPLGYYLYVIELQWYALTGSFTIGSTNMNVRSISAQVVKQ
jgi:hypothetical protein